MTSRLAWLLPIVLVLVVGAFVAITVLLTMDGGGDNSQPAEREDPSEEEDDDQASARLASDVCKGVLDPPDEGEPRVFSPYYEKRRDVDGIEIVGSAGISDRAFDEAEETVEAMFEGNDLEDALVDAQAYVIIVDAGKTVLDLPEFSCLGQRPGSDFYQDICGIADRADYPVVTVSELDLTGSRQGPCGGLNILFHELGHLVQAWSLPPPDYFDVKLLYQDALDAGRYDGAYASRNPNEYFAEATQAYFHHVDQQGRQDRDWLERYDPELYAKLRDVYGE